MIVEEPFGDVGAHPVRAFWISNVHGLMVKVLTYGARLAELHTPDRNGKLANIILGHDRIADYVAGTAYLGATCGRYANRIRDGRFTLDGVAHQLDRNEGPNHLHGGTQGFDRQLWAVDRAEGDSVSFSTTSADGEMGYPGRCRLTTTYRLTDDNRLTLTMQADTTRPTILNMVNHAYFNLAGQGDVLDQHLRITAAHYTPVDAALLPTGEMRPVDGTVFDFRKMKPIGQDLGISDLPKGYDHNWCVEGQGMRDVAEAFDPISGRRLRLRATEPGVQVYIGGSIPDGVTGAGGAALGPYSGFTLETQKYPDSPNHPQFPSARLDPGQTYDHRMEFTFSAG
jgi:aldose 1-epimerase